MFNVQPLEYSYDALEPVICTEIMQLHHDKHLVAFANKFNDAVKGTKWDDMEVSDVLRNLKDVDKDIQTIVRNNGGGVVNHYLWFEQLKPGVELQDGALKDQIIKDFGSVDAFLEEFKTKCNTLFGSGWVWLVYNNGKLEIRQYANQDNPYMENLVPILGVDVWEHAYYIQYKNVRPDYVNEVFTIIDWDVINKRFEDVLNS